VVIVAPHRTERFEPPCTLPDYDLTSRIVFGKSGHDKFRIVRIVFDEQNTPEIRQVYASFIFGRVKYNTVPFPGKRDGR
jgi:hypothetical protein